MFDVHIVMTGKGYHPKAQWQRFADETKTFPDMAAVKVFLRERYGNCKRVPMYQDTKTGTIKAGWVYSFRADDISHVPVNKWIQQDWVSVYKRELIAA